MRILTYLLTVVTARSMALVNDEDLEELLATLGTGTSTLKKTLGDPDLLIEWEDYKKAFNKEYTEEEDYYRMNIYSKSSKWIAKHNEAFRMGNTSYKLSINIFSDMTLEEVTRHRNGFSKKMYTRILEKAGSFVNSIVKVVPLSYQYVPDSLDYRELEWPPMKDQDNNCGSCWAFVTTTAIEYQLKLNHNISVLLSEQQLVDCSKNQGNKGCSGGLMTRAYDYIIANGGITTAHTYPYINKDGICNTTVTNVVKLKGFIRNDKTTERGLKEMLYLYGPCAVAIDSSQPSFFAYKGGYYDEEFCHSTDVNHAIIAVGYGTTKDGNDYWIIRNSWGRQWGEDGYMRISRENNCGVLVLLSVPVIASVDSRIGNITSI